MKQPAIFRTGDPSYFVPASTSGSVSPTVLTTSNASAFRSRVRVRLIGPPRLRILQRDTHTALSSIDRASYRNVKGSRRIAFELAPRARESDIDVAADSRHVNLVEF